MRILAILFGAIFVLSGGCTLLFWGGEAITGAFDAFGLTVAAIGAAVLAFGIWIIVRAARKPAGGRPLP
jgi:hypothetical protein